MSIVQRSFGHLPGGEEATLYTLANPSGASVSITDFGGTLVSLFVQDRTGKLGDVLLGYSSVEGYFPNEGYLGALIGRVGNRIGRGECALNGQALKLAANSNGQHLHGGTVGFDRKMWKAEPDARKNALVLTYVSPDGEENYPGTLRVKVSYAFSDDNALSIRYEATSDKDTLINLTNHAYFNLNGEGQATIEDHVISIDADRFTVVDEACIPTGELRSVDETPFDLRKALAIGEGLKRGEDDEQMRFGQGYDHNFCLNGRGMRPVVELAAPSTGRVMRVLTDQPGVQFYSANMLSGVNPGKCGRKYGRRDGLCLETQNYPDAINHPNFPSPVLRAGERYDTTTIYQFS